MAGLGIASGPAVAATVAVTPGESLSQIARDYHTTVTAIAAANGISNPNRILAGTTLRLPGPSAASVTVTAGETLSAIAEDYGITPTSIVEANALANPDAIFPGEVLALPAKGGQGSGSAAKTVVVAPGDTLSAIAARTGTSIAALTAANGLADPNLVQAGQTLQIPGTGTGSPGPTLSSSTAPAASVTLLPAALLAHPSRLAYLPDFLQSASTYGVPASLLEAVCWWESGWQTTVVSATGAVGMCQIEPSTAAYVDKVLEPGSHLAVTSPAGNIDIGAALLGHLLSATGNNRALAVAGYYQGLASVMKSGMYASTRTYVTGILAYTAIFAAAG